MSRIAGTVQLAASNLTPEMVIPISVGLVIFILFLGFVRTSRRPRPVQTSVIAPRVMTAMDTFSADSMALGVYHVGDVMDCHQFDDVDGLFLIVLNGRDEEPFRSYVTQSLPAVEAVDLIGRSVTYQMTERCFGSYRTDHTVMDYPLVKDVALVQSQSL